MRLLIHKKEKIIKILTILILIVSIFFVFKNIKPKEVTIEDIKLNKNKMVAILVENNGKYENYEGNTFPSSTIYLFNEEKSNCIDLNNNIVNGALRFENNNITIITNKTLNCYLYFDKNKFDIETDMYLVENNNEVSINKTPTTNEHYNYKVAYNCTDNNLITYFNYDYINHNYKINSTGKNACNIYFEKMKPNIEVSVYVNNVLVEDIPTNGVYSLNEGKSGCIRDGTNISAGITYDDVNKKVKVTTKESCKCNIYLEG